MTRTQRPQRSQRQAIFALFALFAFLLSGNAPASAAPARRPGAPPKILNVVRQTLKRGTAAAYAGLEASIARGYRQARIPVYWVCLQSPKNPAAILYLNVHDAPEHADRAAATYRDMVPRHPDLVRLQQRLAGYAASPPVSMLTTRRDEFVYGRGDVDFATMGALRVTVFHVRPGREGEFVDAAQTGRAVPWQIYEDAATSTFFLLAPLRTASEQRDAGLPRALRRLKGIYTVEKPVVYAVRPDMSHAPPEFVTASPKFRRRP